MLEGGDALSSWHEGAEEPDGVEALVEATSQLIHRACNESMPRKIKWNKRRFVYWWSKEIADIRRQCLQSRRKVTRARKKRGNREITQIDVQFKQTKKKLQKTISRNKSLKWTDLTEEVNNDPWGLGYRIVTRKLGAEALEGEIPLFTTKEFVTAVKGLQNRKAPGPDGIPAEALKAAARTSSHVLLNM